MSLSFYSESNETDIPNAPGLYAFYLDMLSPAKIGLSGKGPFSKESLSAARDRLHARIRKRQHLLRHTKLSGELSEDKPGGHLNRVYIVQASASNELDAVDISSVALHEIREFANVLSNCMALDKPIYVGITNDQSLRQRYLQHKTDFYSEPHSDASFGARFSSAGGDWDDLKLGCIELESSVFGTKSVARLERIVQTLTRPRYSLR